MIVLPKRKRGRQTKAAAAEYEAQLTAFTDGILQINSTLDFKVSSRGWCYILEEHGLFKGDFDSAQALIVQCRKDGLLRLDIVAEDENRKPEGLPGYVDYQDPESYADAIIENIKNEPDYYWPLGFWDDKDVYVEMLVEKIDLKSLFSKVCRLYHVPLANARGWADVSSRARMMERFSRHEAEGKQCVLLYCGDHDPGGLNISDALMKNLADLERAVGWSPHKLEIVRFGLNSDFIEENNLTWIDNLETSSGTRLDDPKHPDHFKPYVQNYIAEFGARKVEANALVVRPKAGRKLCHEAINQYVSIEEVVAFNKRIKEQQQLVRDALPVALERWLDKGGLQA